MNKLRPYEAHYNLARRSAKRRHINFEMSFEEFLDQVVSSGRCHYCYVPLVWNNSHRASFVDRKDNKLGYISGNVVACCARCNVGKNSHFSYDEWFLMCSSYRETHAWYVREGFILAT